MVDESESFSGWSQFRRPPESATAQHAWLWHIEFVLRHCIFACLRTSFGQNWERILELTGDPVKGRKRWSFLEKAEGYRRRARKQNEFEVGHEPNLIWFLSLRDLIALVTQNWEDVFIHVFGTLGPEQFKDAMEPVARIRDRCAHLRPVQPAEANTVLSHAIAELSPDVRRWTAAYWNATATDASKKKLQHLSEDFAARFPDSVPLLLEPVGGYHGGFRQVEAEADRGWALFLQINEAGTVLWVQPTPVGASGNLGLSDAKKYGIQLADLAIHVAANFDEDFNLDLTADGLFGLRISFPLADGDEALLDALQQMSEVTTERRLRPVRNVSKTEAIAGSKLLTMELVRERLFYEAPPNVLIAPTQESQRQ